jgi:hypothetical protein
MEDAFSSHCCFTPTQLQLVGAYFLHEYSFEAAALFNPSIVPHPNQSGVAPGAIRFILSLRAVGEGHISSLTFRCGTFGRWRCGDRAPDAASPPRDRARRRQAGPCLRGRQRHHRE